MDSDGKIIKRTFKPPHGRKKVIGICLADPTIEKIFPSISEAARAMGADRQSIGKCIKGDKRYSHVKGYVWRALDLDGTIIENDGTIDDRIRIYNETHPLINGERHTITEWCAIYGISKHTYYDRINRMGMTPIEAIITEKMK